MPEQIEIESSPTDALLTGVELPRRATYYPLGFPVELASNSLDVMEAAAESWDLFSREFDRPALRVFLGVAESGGAQLPARPKFRSRGHLMSIVSNAENFAVCDFSRAVAFGWVTRRAAAHHGFLRRHFLEAATLSMLTQASLAPIHGALVARNGCGVVLCGETFSGKSSLAYACARAGWTFTSDDGTFLVREHSDRYAVGNPHTLHLRPDARQLFPELSNRLVTTRPGGKVGLELFTRDLSVAIAPGCVIEHLVFLNRHASGPAHLESFPYQQALPRFERNTLYGEDRVQAAQRLAYRRLANTPMWEMRYASLDGAVARLERLITDGD
jgi:hypothetical protein